MKSLLCFLILLFSHSESSCFAAEVPKFRTDGFFSSPQEFISTALQFRPNKENDFMAFLFAVCDKSQEEDPQDGIPVLPESIASANLLWQGGGLAVAFVTASPGTLGTRSEVGVIFCLKQQTSGKWRITDLERFVTYGKNCGLSFARTSNSPTPSEDSEPIFTLTRYEGGSHFSDLIATSYKLINMHFLEVH